jgi:uncharacterized protein
MWFNVAQLLKESVGATRHYEVDEPGDILGDLPADHVRGEVELLRTARGILAKANLNLNVRQVCSRCLDEIVAPLTVLFEEEFFPRIDVHTGAAVELPDEPDALTIDEHHTLDLTEVTRQYAWVALPLAPLCKEDCAGLCPECGVNRNRETCSCQPPVHERWAALGSLLGPS